MNPDIEEVDLEPCCHKRTVVNGLWFSFSGKAENDGLRFGNAFVTVCTGRARIKALVCVLKFSVTNILKF